MDPIQGAFEKHFTIAQLADMWGLGYSTVLRMFQDEPGVLRSIRRITSGGSRGRAAVRVPESVAMRVYRERCGRG